MLPWFRLSPIDALENLSETPCVDSCLKRHMQWLGHVCWRPDHHPVYCIGVHLGATGLVQTGQVGPS